MKTNKSTNAVKAVEQKLLAYEAQLLRREENAAIIDWPDFCDQQEQYRHSIVRVRNRDFAQGTLRIKEPCMIQFQESVVFAPNTENDFFPRAEQLEKTYDKFSYRLGFFTAITVETTESVIIDLNGYTLAASELFAVQQRFHSLIELGDQPFNPNTGPADFGPDIRVAKNVWIRNGTMGRTAHHSIHGNGCENIVISGVTFQNYEVAAVSLNGCRKVYIKDCQCDGTNTTTPVLGTYSAARFCSIFGRQTLRILEEMDLPDAEEIGESVAYLREALHDLDRDLNGFLEDFQKVIEARDYQEKLNYLHNLKKHTPFFNGPQNSRDPRKFYGLTDGNAYGIAFHSRGPLVNSFNCPGESFENISDLSKALETTDIVLERVNISSTKCNVREILALAEIEDSGSSGRERQLKPPIHDISGAVFQFFETFDGQPGNMSSSGEPQLTTLGKAQIALADIKFLLLTYYRKQLVEEYEAHLNQLGFLLGRSNIPKEIIDWAKEGKAIKRVRFSSTDYQLSRGFRMQVLCNGDTMHHVNKGCIGLFIQSVDGLVLDNVIISGVQNTGFKGEDSAGNYLGPKDGGHPGQDNIVGYSGADARGIYIGACSKVELRDPKVFSVTADYGSSFGIEIANGNHHVTVENPIVANCHGGGRLDKNDIPELPNKPCRAIGLAVTNHNTLVRIGHPKIMGPISQAWTGSVNRIEICSLDTEILS